MIALLCPTRGRPEQFKRMAESALSTASNQANIKIYACSNGGDNYVSPAPKDSPTVYLWNKMADLAKSDFAYNHRLFMLAADDVIFTTPGWDEALMEHYNALENKIHVYALRDSRDADGVPHPIVTREYVDAMGYFVPPIFLHWRVDTWTVDIARDNGVFSHLKDYLLIHDKPSDRGEGDETHNRIRRSGWRERDQYVNDTCQHFLQVEKGRLRGIIMNNHHQKFSENVGQS